MDLSKIENSLNSLEESFDEFKLKQEKRWKNFYNFSGNNVGNFSEDSGNFYKNTNCKNVKFPKNQHNKEFLDRNFLTYLRTGLRVGENEMHQKGLYAAEGSGSFMVPHAAQEYIDERLLDLCPMRRIARTTAISSDKLDIILDNTDADAGWVSENDERNETTSPDVRKISAHIHELYCKPRISQQLLDDAFVNVSYWISQKISEQMSVAENRAFLFGDGNKKPEGLLSKKFVYQKTKTQEEVQCFKTGEDGSIKTCDSLVLAMMSLDPKMLSGSHWIMGKNAMSLILGLKDEYSGRYVWQQSVQDGIPSTLFGYPVILMDDMPDIAIAKDSIGILFGNFKNAYQIVDRSGISILRDPYSAKPHVEFYATKRVGGVVLDTSAYRAISFSKN